MATKIRKLAALLVLILWGHAVNATPENYTVTLDAILNNPSGTWGGNLNIGEGQHLNLTIIYQYDSVPTISGADWSDFTLISLQVIDNTNGLASGVIPNGYGASNIRICYHGNSDYFCGLSGYFPGGWIFPSAEGKFGHVGDKLPTGEDFDLAVNTANIAIEARAEEDSNDNIAGVNGPIYSAGDFFFSSQGKTAPYIDISGTWDIAYLFGTSCKWEGTFRFIQPGNLGSLSGRGKMLVTEGGCLDIGPGPIKGTIDGNHLEFVFPEGGTAEFDTIGIVEGDGITGTWSNAPTGFNGTWSASRQMAVVGSAVTNSGFPCKYPVLIGRPGTYTATLPNDYTTAFIETTYNTKYTITNSKNGNVNLSCHGQLEFGSTVDFIDSTNGEPVVGTVVPFDEMCEVLAVVSPGVCKGNGAAVLNYQSTSAPCIAFDGLTTEVWREVISPSGKVTLSCEFK